MKNPCKVCIVYAMCKSRVHSFIGERSLNVKIGSANPIALSYFEQLDECPYLFDYIMYKLNKDRASGTIVLDTIKETFKIKGIENEYISPSV